jgi:hypothetical protein
MLGVQTRIHRIPQMPKIRLHIMPRAKRGFAAPQPSHDVKDVSVAPKRRLNES